MKVKELIEKLQQLDSESMAVVSGYEGGVDEINEAKNIRIKLNANTEFYYGDHEPDENGDCNAIYIGR